MSIDSSLRVLRGGSWYGGAGYLRSAGRSYALPGDRYVNVGLRLLRARIKPLPFNPVSISDGEMKAKQIEPSGFSEFMGTLLKISHFLRATSVYAHTKSARLEAENLYKELDKFLKQRKEVNHE